MELTAVNRNLFHTERAIEQRERETIQHQQTTRQFTYQTVREIEKELSFEQDKGYRYKFSKNYLFIVKIFLSSLILSFFEVLH